MISFKLRTLVLVAGFVAASLSTSAGATGVITATSDGYTFSGFSVAGVIDDYLAFTVTSSELVGTLSGSVKSKAGNSITFTQFDIVDAAHTVLIDGTTTAGVFKAFGDLDGTVGAGSYFLHIAGTSVGSSQYAGTLSVSAVPEPETYGMMLAGLGLMGFVASRRKSA